MNALDHARSRKHADDAIRSVRMSSALAIAG